ncbi:MAG TPA: helicase C-terminal domain-containing protein [Vicinamibacterales bacterium]|nr:helicase C-terminal domain-containing protein [Vicinamibacterales bacterium]
MPEVPAVPGLAGVTASVFRAGGALSNALPEFEPRAGQAEMAARVADVFDAGGILLAEAGTGTGKTLAYLVPAILSRQRVLISTGTKNLQEQIYFKDIPALRQALDVPFTATYMKGRANYLCLHRLDQLSDGNHPLSRDVFLPMIRDWSSHTETGDRAELQDLPEDLPFWSEVAATAEACIGTECPRFTDCFVTRMRQRAAESDVVIVNHHLLCADAAVRQNAFGEVIPACSYAIVDEAHQLEDVATQYFGFSISNYRIDDYARDVERFIRSGAVTTRTAQDELQKAVDRLRDHGRAFFTEVAYAHRTTERARGEERVRATDASLAHTREVAAYLAGALDLVESALALLKPAGTPENGEPRAPQDSAALARRAGEIRDELRFLLRAADPAYVYFVEFRGKGVFLRAAPIDVSAIIRDLLLDRMQGTVLTSATLTVDGGFEYLRARLGIERAEEIRLPSEFDYARQALLYLPPRMPDPRSAEFTMAAGKQVVELLKRSRGRAFVLFTSYASLRAVQAIAEMALDYPMLVQGTAPRSQLLKQFRDTANSVLFATSSFWQGVDVAGEALSCVIVDKLPFASPGDPITAARIEAIRARGGEPFDEYQVPLAILALQQGLGRLIRHRKDRGVLAVLDPRMRTKGYGRRFIASVPPAPVVYDLDAVEGFFSIV